MTKNMTISPLSVNGMDGRKLTIKSDNNPNKEIMLVYGHHASLERMQSMAEYLAEYGNVTICDLPGFGGMTSFYDVGMKPSLDNYADYLAAIIKLRFKRKRIILIGTSFSFLIVTRMLQKHPSIVKQIDLLFSLVGFTHHEDFKLRKLYFNGLKLSSTILSTRLGSLFFRYTALTKPAIWLTYNLFSSRNPKMITATSRRELNQRIKADTRLWQINDVRTRFATLGLMFKVDLCCYNKRIDQAVYHIYVGHDVYIDQYLVEQHMKIIYSDYASFKSPMEAHMPSIVADAQEAGLFFPEQVKELLKNA